MAPYTGIPLSPAELSYLHTSLAQSPPIRPDGRGATQFRPLVAETDILPTTNGSARICFPDGTEAIVGVKAEVEKSKGAESAMGEAGAGTTRHDRRDPARGVEDEDSARVGQGRDEWVEIAIDIPGTRDDDALPVFLSAMLTEALLADGGLRDSLWINARFHWRLYIDILLLSQPLSYPLPLLSLTTHLALLSTRLPSLISKKDEDPLFNDDWEASTPLYPQTQHRKPPITLLVMSVGPTILFDPSADELAVADAVVAISVATQPPSPGSPATNPLKVIALRTIDPPSRLTAPGIPSALHTTPGATSNHSLSPAEAMSVREKDAGQSVWRPPRGGVKRDVLSGMIKEVVKEGGVGREVLEGLARVET
ncbi:Exosome complex component rrp42 [Teratosphaeriaceae sp. CCFEE 6253]|nr:Exosome complex component rrp42 [Teratosphaeriaceae sp. CCFEE 6253]